MIEMNQIWMSDKNEMHDRNIANDRNNSNDGNEIMEMKWPKGRIQTFSQARQNAYV